MSATEWKAKTRSALLAGTSRQPLPAEVAGMPLGTPNDAGLRALSLLGQALRFAPPLSPGSFETEALLHDPRAVLPEGLRRPLLRLLCGRTATEHPALALAEAFDRLRLRPHPFDLPRLDAFVRSHAERLGTTAQHWAQPQHDPSGEDEVLDPQNWTLSSAAKRALWLEQSRQSDPAAALEMLQTAWPNDTADTRLRLLGSLRLALHEGDRAFLEGLSKDRAPRIRTLAARLLQQLDGGAGNAALAALLTRIGRGETGFLRKRPTLSLELPATVKEQAALGWVRDQFAEVSFAELARALALDEVELIEAAARDSKPERLLIGLALLATADRRLDLFEYIVSNHLHTAWELLFQTGLQALDPMPAPERLRWAQVLVAPYGSKPPAIYLLWSWLHRMLAEPGPATLADTILKTPWLDDLADLERQGPQWLEVIAALCPPAHRAALRTRLTPLDAALNHTALALLDILIAMENTRPDA